MTAAPILLAEALRADGGLLQTGPFGSQLKQSEYSDEGVPVIMPKDIHNGGVSLDTVARVPEAIAERLARHRVALNGIVLPRRGEVTKRAFIGEDQAGWLCGTGCLKIEARGKTIWPKFLYYYLGSPASVEWLERNAVGSTMLNLSAEIVGRFPLRLPTLEQQKESARILTEYDDLIENYRRRIALLEEAARLLYREWFVHLRFPGHEHFRVVDGVPEGWVRRSLGEVADCRLGKMLDQKKNKGELMPYLANVNVRWGAIDLDNLREMRFEDDELDAVGLRYGDIVMCEGGEPGRCALWKEQVPKMVIQKAIHRIRAHEEMSYLFLYRCLRYQGESGQLTPLFTGATIKHLPREKLVTARVVAPPAPLMAVFAEHVEPVEKQIVVLEAASRRASNARDLLLPRLMNGEIAV